MPLIVEHEIVSLPSASVMALIRREPAGRKSPLKSVAVLADPVFDKDDPRVKTGTRGQGLGGREEPASTRSPTPNPEPRVPQSHPRAPNPESPPPEVIRSARDLGILSFERLEESRTEAQAIAALAPEGQSLTALDFAASRATAMSDQLRQYRIVHFATHGLLNNKHPELSGIVLSLVDDQGQPQNGFLSLHNIYNLKLGADLVVLSACQTALGKEIRGEGLLGLTRGIMYAGAARVVASLWKVEDDATAELMKRFYEGMLKKGLSPAAALREAQVSLWQGPKRMRRNPFYWAGFILQGEWK